MIDVQGIVEGDGNNFLREQQHLFLMFQEIIPILLRGSLRIKEIPYEELSHEEVEELEANERGVSIETFRESSSETILKAFCLLSDNFKYQG